MYKITPWHYYNTTFTTDDIKTAPNFSGGDPRDELLKLDASKPTERISLDSVRNLIIKSTNALEKDSISPFSDKLEHLYLLTVSDKIEDNLLDNFKNLVGFYVTYNNHLVQIPKGIFNKVPTLKKLVINYTEVNLTPGIFTGLKCLEDLDLQENGVTELGGEILSDLPSLQRLILAHNKISKINACAFKNNVALTLIDLSNNRLESWSSDTLSDNNTLKYLKLSHNRLEDNVRFGNLAQLLQLNLDFNRIQKLDKIVFGENMEHLDYLALNSNKISSIEEDTFKLQALRVLLLDHNKIRNLPPKVFENLPLLQHLSLDHNDCATLQIDVFTPLKSLNNLVLSRCNLIELNNPSHTGPECLLNLHLEDNNLAQLSENAFSGFSAVTTLDLNDSKIEVLENKWCVGLDALKQLNLSGNKLTKLCCDSFKTLQHLKTLNLSGNLIVEIEKGAFNDLNELTSLNLCDNKMEVVCEYMFDNLGGLRSLALGNNELTIIKNNSLESLTNLIYLDLSENRIVEVEESAFANIKNLVTLDLGYNGLTKMPCLAHTPELAKLVLSYNCLTEFDSHMLKTLPNLIQLYIDNNNIKTVDAEMIEKSAIREFSFDNNKLDKEVVNKIGAILQVRQIRRRVSVRIEPRVKSRKVLL